MGWQCGARCRSEEIPLHRGVQFWMSRTLVLIGCLSPFRCRSEPSAHASFGGPSTLGVAATPAGTPPTRPAPGTSMDHPPMKQPLPTESSNLTAPSFYITGRQPLRPGAILLATVAAAGALFSVLYALAHNGHAHLTSGSSGAARSASATSGAPAADEKDDPSRIDTIILGDPADAPVPARRGDHVSPVHPFIVVHLPRFGDQLGLIPDTPAGHLLYDWLAAFNRASYPALGNALPNRSEEHTSELQ